jgi:hypothetical protein
MYNR